ncbi:hypothetical protein [Parafrankia sp. EUN1f]|uniref:hypothetical protein n=1 Tax=Parafrankia sp. EUN1f TaxID=102897 RepID=UPI0001C46459|nr:hypothetical protein [Parafrankia sp. EUN1f]EFC80889.1 hypothetical protein FrEUN1fDRAFT_5991 [Parafrankia sp. EUN1f]
MDSSTDAPGGSAGRASAEGRPETTPSPHRLVSGARGQAAGGHEVGREPVISAVDSAPSSPLPVRVPHTSWPAGVRRLSADGRRAVQPVSGRAGTGADERKWSVVVLDDDGDPLETVTGFSSLDSADGYARLSWEIVRWTVVPSRPVVPDRIPQD